MLGPLDYWFIGPLVECQMLNVNKVNILTERTSGVPPVIFILHPAIMIKSTEGHTPTLQICSQSQKFHFLNSSCVKTKVEIFCGFIQFRF